MTTLYDSLRLSRSPMLIGVSVTCTAFRLSAVAAETGWSRTVLLIYPSARVTSVVNSKRARAVDDGRAPLPPV